MRKLKGFKTFLHLVLAAGSLSVSPKAGAAV
jgi:hypothetical protein